MKIDAFFIDISYRAEYNTKKAGGMKNEDINRNKLCCRFHR